MQQALLGNDYMYANRILKRKEKKIIIHLERVSRWWWAPFYYVEEEHWHIYCNDLNYKNLFTIIWDNFRKQRWWKGREKNICRKIIDDASQILLSSSPPLLYVCIASQRYWQRRSLILIYIIASFLLRFRWRQPIRLLTLSRIFASRAWLRYHQASYTLKNYFLQLKIQKFKSLKI